MAAKQETQAASTRCFMKQNLPMVQTLVPGEGHALAVAEESWQGCSASQGAAAIAAQAAGRDTPTTSSLSRIQKKAFSHSAATWESGWQHALVVACRWVVVASYHLKCPQLITSLGKTGHMCRVPSSLQRFLLLRS